jgi:aspartate/tyrosine/aromatic aminotransferase
VQRLRAEHHIYLTPDGRMAMCGLRSSTVERVARAMDAVLRHRLLTQARL